MRQARVTWEVLAEAEAVAGFDADWDRLALASASATAFQSAAWHRAWAQAVARTERKTPLLIKVHACGAPAAGLALQLGSDSGRVVVSPLSSPWADYHDAVGTVADSQVRQALIEALAQVAAESSASVELTELISGGLLDQSLPSRLPREQATAVLGIDLTDQAHLLRLAQVREHERKLRRLTLLGDVTCRHYESRQEIDTRFGRLVDLHNLHWAGRDDAVAPFDPVIEAGFRAMIRHMAPAGQVLFTEFALGGEVIACYFGLRWKRWYGAYRTAYDARYRRYSPGHLMLHAMIGDFADSGLTCLDLTRGAYQYKFTYASRVGSNLAVRCDPADLLPCT